MLAFSAACLAPAVRDWDDALQKRATTTVERPVEILGFEVTMSYAEVERRLWHERPLLILTLAIIGVGLVAAATSLRSLVLGRPTYTGIAGLGSGLAAIAIVLYVNPLGWLFLLALIPAVAAVMAAAAFAAVPSNGVPGLDGGGGW